MTGVVVVSHGEAGAAMVAAAERLVGKLPLVVIVGVAAGEAPEQLEGRLEEAVRAVGGQRVVFLVDLGGSTPANLCGRLRSCEAAVVSGMNLAMLFKLATADRAASPRALAEELASTGHKSIQVRGEPWR